MSETVSAGKSWKAWSGAERWATVWVAALRMAGTVYLWGWSLSLLWDWFIMPLSPTLPPLGILPAYGLRVFAVALTTNLSDAKEQTKAGRWSEWAAGCVGTLSAPLAVAGIGWLVHYLS